MKKMKEGDIVNGKVVVVADYGVFVEIQTGVEALVHKNIKVRGGYQSINSVAPSSFGVELLLTRFAVDVSVHPSDIFGSFYRFGITFNKES